MRRVAESTEVLLLLIIAGGWWDVRIEHCHYTLTLLLRLVAADRGVSVDHRLGKKTYSYSSCYSLTRSESYTHTWNQ